VKKAVVCSSNAATGLNHTNRHLAPLYLPIDEAHPLRPSHAYGLSKQVTEIVGESFARRQGMAVIIIRPVYIMFPELVTAIAARVNDPATGDFPSEAARATAQSLAELEPLSLLRAYVRPEDAARAFRLALAADLGGYDLFYVAANDSFEPRPTLDYVEWIYGRVPEVRKPEVYAANPHASVFDCGRARELLDWRPELGWEQLSGTRRR
jgi:nucleoside-diphosphate-sugar epimerase